MTPLQKRCQELLPVIQAGAEGKALQTRKSNDGPWVDLHNPQSNECRLNLLYRIKPEPHYRPFTPEEAIEHCGREFWHRGSHKGDQSWRILGVSKTGFVNRPVGVESDNIYDTTFGFLRADCVFVDDGKPCGVLID